MIVFATYLHTYIHLDNLKKINNDYCLHNF